MKISKLFHWLYACLMLLPIFAIGVTCGYAMFNKNAVDSYSGKNSNSIQVDAVDNFIANNNYVFNSASTGTNLLVSTPNALSITNFEIVNTYSSSDYQWLDTNDIVSIMFANSGSSNIYIRLTNTANANRDINLKTSYIKFNFTYVNGEINDTYVKSLFNEYVYSDNYYIDNVFYYSVDKVTRSPLFSWAYDSFLSAPFVYILDLFGVPSTHVMVELLSYWLSVSIIWLVFDLIMYVPLLAHRWIDKGVLE